MPQLQTQVSLKTLTWLGSLRAEFWWAERIDDQGHPSRGWFQGLQLLASGTQTWGRHTASSPFRPAVQTSRSPRGRDKAFPPSSNPEALSKREKVTNQVCCFLLCKVRNILHERLFPSLGYGWALYWPRGPTPGPMRPKTWWERSPEALTQGKGLCEQWQKPDAPPTDAKLAPERSVVRMVKGPQKIGNTMTSAWRKTKGRRKLVE